MKILIIGGGNMGMTYAHSFLRSHITSKQDMMILERSPEKAAELATKDIGTVYGQPDECMTRADLIILAVKPQDAASLFASIRHTVDAQQVFLSIMAGVQIATISEALGAKKIIRAMPNLPAQIGMGMTAFTSSEEVTRIELVTVQNLLNTTGKTVYVENESAIDGATAISGSGPAYVWFFMNAMLKAAQNMGFTYSESELLVRQTFQGAIELYNATDYSFEEWIQKVCSKGGTTEAALNTYRKNDLEQRIINGATAALHRAQELGSK
ncbi:MAG: pyrroline-5-carboxylate reductase [Saprospiraceae bacterium]|nr:MAG: pyrroline-5-carboxylate reductase [Saprospiraceae bacterium]